MTDLPPMGNPRNSAAISTPVPSIPPPPVSAISAPIVMPIFAPAVATTDKIDWMVTVSKGLAGLIAFANANPELLAALEKQFGTQIGAWMHSTAGTVSGALIGWAFAKFGVAADPTVTGMLCFGGGLVGSAIWAGVVALWRRVMTPATPAT
ncbi:MAG TPA: hypothetical protein VIO57_10150 [Chloroflexota bacterium]|jgi:hypothetical protein